MSNDHPSVFVTIRNIVANWGGYIANILVTFFLAPFVVQTLGDTWYGIWTVLMSLAGSMGLVELGVVVTTGRMVNFHLGKSDPQRVSAVINLSLVFFAVVASLIVLATWVFRDSLAATINGLPDGELTLVGYALVILAANVAFGLINSVFAVLLQARHRFDLKNGVDILVLLVRTVGTVIVLKAGMGIAGLAWVTFGSAVLSLICMTIMARWKGHWPEFGLGFINRDVLREMAGFSGWAFLNQASARIFLYTNIIMIGLISDAVQVTYFSIALMLVDYAAHLASQIGGALTPELNRAAGAGDKARMRASVIYSTQLATVPGIPVMVGIVFFVEPFIALWMGERYALQSGTIATILIAGHFAGVVTGPIGIMIWSIGRIRPIAIINLIMAIIDGIAGYLVLSHTDYGLAGIATVTALINFFINAIAITLYGTHLLEWPLRSYLAVVIRYPLPALMAYGLIAWALSQGHWISDWVSFFAVIFASLILYAPFAWWFLVKPFLRGRSALLAANP